MPFLSNFVFGLKNVVFLFGMNPVIWLRNQMKEVVQIRKEMGVRNTITYATYSTFFFVLVLATLTSKLCHIFKFVWNAGPVSRYPPRL